MCLRRFYFDCPWLRLQSSFSHLKQFRPTALSHSLRLQTSQHRTLSWVVLTLCSRHIHVGCCCSTNSINRAYMRTPFNIAALSCMPGSQYPISKSTPDGNSGCCRAYVVRNACLKHCVLWCILGSQYPPDGNSGCCRAYVVNNACLKHCVLWCILGSQYPLTAPV